MNDPAATMPIRPTAPTHMLYVLGVGGPIDEEGIGHVERFAWRFLVREAPGERDAVLGFTSMPRLMAFTRAVNERRPRAVSTEAFKVAAHRFSVGGTSAPIAEVDMAADGFEAWLGRGSLVERILPELEG